MKKEIRGFSGSEGIISDKTIDNISRVIYYRIIKEGMIFMKWADIKQDINSISQEEKDLIELTALLTNLRKNKNITQAELAAKVNVTQAQIARVENYSYIPTLKTITKIARGLDLKLAFVDKSTNEVVKS